MGIGFHCRKTLRPEMAKFIGLLFASIFLVMIINGWKINSVYQKHSELVVGGCIDKTLKTSLIDCQVRCDFEWSYVCTFYVWSPTKKTCCISGFTNMTAISRHGDDRITFKRMNKKAAKEETYKGQKLRYYY